MRENLETFLAEGVQRSASGEGYPRYVEKELRDNVHAHALLPDGVFVLDDSTAMKIPVMIARGEQSTT
jgi:hypothetical protein